MLVLLGAILAKFMFYITDVSIESHIQLYSRKRADFNVNINVNGIYRFFENIRLLEGNT